MGPVIEPSSFLAEYVLNFLNAGMLRRCLDQPLNPRFEFERLLVELRRPQLLGTQFHSSSQ